MISTHEYLEALKDADGIAAKLYRERKARKLTMADLASAAQMSRPTYKSIEGNVISGNQDETIIIKDAVSPTMDQLMHLAEALDCDPGYLLGLHQERYYSDSVCTKELGLSTESIELLRQVKKDNLSFFSFDRKLEDNKKLEHEDLFILFVDYLLQNTSSVYPAFVLCTSRKMMQDLLTKEADQEIIQSALNKTNHINKGNNTKDIKSYLEGNQPSKFQTFLRDALAHRGYTEEELEQKVNDYTQYILILDGNNFNAWDYYLFEFFEILVNEFIHYTLKDNFPKEEILQNLKCGVTLRSFFEEKLGRHCSVIPNIDYRVYFDTDRESSELPEHLF